MLVGVIFGILLIDSPKGGRRVQLLVATVMMGPSLVGSGFIVAFTPTTAGTSYPGWIGAVFLCIFAFGFQGAWGMIPWVYPSEIFSNRERETAMGFAVGFQYFVNAWVYAIAPNLMLWSKSGTMFVFGAFNVTNFIFCYACIRETKGVPLEEVPQLFDSASKGNQVSSA